MKGRAHSPRRSDLVPRSRFAAALPFAAAHRGISAVSRTLWAASAPLVNGARRVHPAPACLGQAPCHLGAETQAKASGLERASRSSWRALWSLLSSRPNHCRRPAAASPARAEGEHRARAARSLPVVRARSSVYDSAKTHKEASQHRASRINTRVQVRIVVSRCVGQAFAHAHKSTRTSNCVARTGIHNSLFLHCLTANTVSDRAIL